MPHSVEPTSVQFAGLTDVGRVRSQNEDSFQIESELGLVLVADGMGGHVGGDIASRTAIEAVNDFILEYEPMPDEAELAGTEGSMEIVRTAVHRANQRIAALNHERGLPENRGMGTTIVGFWLPSDLSRAIVFHVGDSRLYRLRNGRLDQITHDHSLYQAWVDGGHRGEPPNRNIIMRALGVMEDVEADVAVEEPRAGDLYLLCSDGLNGMVPDDTIIDILIEPAPLDEACRKLVEAANAFGGRDNITVALIRFD
jgi:protein phosphatase